MGCLYVGGRICISWKLLGIQFVFIFLRCVGYSLFFLVLFIGKSWLVVDFQGQSFCWILGVYFYLCWSGNCDFSWVGQSGVVLRGCCRIIRWVGFVVFGLCFCVLFCVRDLGFGFLLGEEQRDCFFGWRGVGMRVIYC